MLDFLAVGDVMLDVRLPSAPTGARQHGVITSTAAGSAVNAARAAVRLGARAGVAGAIGDDTVGRVIALELEAAGIEPHLARIDASTTGTAVYSRDAVVADRGANAFFVPQSLPDARVTLVSGYLPAAARRRALALAHGLRGVDLQGVAEDAGDADVVIGPHLDLEALTGHHPVVCSTLGADGAAAVRGGEHVQEPPSRVLAASPVGAGDAFAAAFLLALADDLPLAECVRRGCAAAIS
ncbi:MAG TPA: PfkB family carbohydrate kinase [Gaiellaceae bacterium]